MTWIILNIIFIIICIIDFAINLVNGKYYKTILDYMSVLVFVFFLFDSISEVRTGKDLYNHIIEDKTINVYVINSDNDTTFVGEIKNDTVYIVNSKE